jgi:hypothetical protein
MGNCAMFIFFVSNHPASVSGYIPLPKEILGKDEWLHFLLCRNFWVLNVHYISDTNIAIKDSMLETQTLQYLKTCKQIILQQKIQIPSKRLNNISNIFFAMQMLVKGDAVCQRPKQCFSLLGDRGATIHSLSMASTTPGTFIG